MCCVYVGERGGGEGGIVCLCVHMYHLCVTCIPDTSFNSPSGCPGEPHVYQKDIEELSDSANSAKIWLQLFIQWWVEYSSNYDEVCPWLKGAESQLEQLVVREESIQSPPVSPKGLLQDAKVGV